MNLQALLAILDIPMSIRAMIDKLVKAKRQTNKAANARRFPELDALIHDELRRAEKPPKRELADHARMLADGIFLDLVSQ